MLFVKTNHKPSPGIGTTLSKERSKIKNMVFRSMSFKELAFFVDIKRTVVKTHIQMITAPKVLVIFT